MGRELAYYWRYYKGVVCLMAVNILIFLWTEITGGSQDTWHMVKMGAAYTPLIVNGGQWYRLFTCMFLHFGMAHLLNNMLSLAVLGERMEYAFGLVRFLLVYLLGGLCGNLFSLWWDIRCQDFSGVSAGASGAVFALLGSMLWVVLRNRGQYAGISLQRFAIMAALSLYSGFASPGVNNVAHIGGFVGGFVLGIILYRPGSGHIGRRQRWKR